MNDVTISFSGNRAEEMARKFFTYLVDGGLEDQVIDHLSDAKTTVEIGDCDAHDRKVVFVCRPIKG
ncbi:hypothetical protein KBA41_06450 [Candidatus Ozemobacteraceae bacterium]|nr:hypothetical protein [Candidatus Ozemobacteraceae bacterium]